MLGKTRVHLGLDEMRVNKLNCWLATTTRVVYFSLDIFLVITESRISNNGRLSSIREEHIQKDVF